MIAFKKLTQTAQIPKRNKLSDAGLDLHIDEVVTIYSGQVVTCSTGIAMSIPDGYYGDIRPRSGLAVKYGINTLAGVIDSGYRGEIKVCLINHGERPITFNVGDRIAQLLIKPVDISQPVEVKVLDDSDRGTDGFGSSGL